MSMNKKNIIFLVSLFLLISSSLMVDAAPQYVGANFCGESAVLRVLKLVGVIIIVAKIAIPLILIVIGSLDLYKAVLAKDGKDLTSSLRTFVFRLLAGVLVFFVPTIVNAAFDLLSDSTTGEATNNQCIKCVLDINQC